MDTQQNFSFRYEPCANDIRQVREIVESTGFFHDFEVDVAVELVEERLQSGPESGYFFVFAEIEGKPIGYTCFGTVPCTKHSFDIYWIAVHNDARGKGTGAALLKETERLIGEMGGNGVYLETSSTEKYLPTRNFYLKCGYAVEAQIKDFYDFGDDKVIFSKRLRS